MEPVSVIIPLYNKEKYIKRAIFSVINQNIEEIEIIVVDDGSLDSGAKVVETIADSRIKLIKQKNMGVSAARNTGIEAASNSLIAFLDADDEWKPEFLSTIQRLRAKFPRAGIYATAYETMNDDNQINRVNYHAVPPAPWEGLLPDFFLSMQGQPPVWTSAAVIPKLIFDDVGLFKIGETIGEDVEMWCRIAFKYPVAFSRESCSVYHLEAENRTYVRAAEHKKATGYIETLQEALKKTDNDNFVRRGIEMLIEKIEIGYASSLILADKKEEGRRQLNGVKTKYLKKVKLMWQVLSFIPPKWLASALRFRKKLR